MSGIFAFPESSTGASSSGAATENVQSAIDIQSTVIYVGTAARGEATSDPVWTIKKVTLSSGNPTAITWTDEESAVWDNRTSEAYS